MTEPQKLAGGSVEAGEHTYAGGAVAHPQTDAGIAARVVPALLGALASVGWHARQGGWVPDEGAEKKTVAVFAHGGSLNAMLSFVLGVPPFPVGRFSFPYCGVATVSFAPRRGVWHPALELPAPAVP